MRKLDLLGKIFGYWTVINEQSASGGGHIKWLCKCICGTERNVVGSSLINGTSVSCGCVKPKKIIDNPTDYLNRTFGRLIVISLDDPVIDNEGKIRTAYLCKCDCGNELIVKRHVLQNPKGPKSCGCLLAEQRSNLGLNKRKYEPRIATAKMIFGQRYSDGDLEFDDFMTLSQQECYWCGLPPSTAYNKYAHRGQAKVSDFAIQNGTFLYNGLDRLDSNEPHNKDNCVPSCIACNTAKSDRTTEEFLMHNKRIYLHQQQKGYNNLSTK
jgi:hypothetical protein